MDGRVGGPPVRAISVAKGLKQHGMDSIFVLPKGGDFKHLLSDEGFAFYEIVCHGPTNPSRVGANLLWLTTFPITVFQIMQIIKKENISIVHLNGLIALQGGLAGFLRRRKIVWHLSSCLYPKMLVRVLMPMVKAISHRMIIVSEAIRSYHFGEGAIKNAHVSVIQECVDTDMLDPQAVTREAIEKTRQRLGIGPSARIVGQVGNVNPIKSYENFIRAAHAISQVHSDVQFVIAGALLDTQQAYIAMLRRLSVELGIEDRVFFLGSIEAKKLPSLLATFDIFLMTSCTEGGPRVTLEAMAMQLPVIATDVGDVCHQIENGKDGFVVDVGDWKQAGKIAARLLSAPELSKRIGLESRRKVTERFNQSAMIDKHRHIYETLATENVITNARDYDGQ